MNVPQEKNLPARILGLDLARAVALIGMALVNFNMGMSSGHDGPAWLVWLVELIPGRAAVTFVLLAGVGMSLMTRRARLSVDPDQRRNGRRRLLKRALILFLIGLLFETVWDGDILHYYGFYIAIGSVMLFMSSAALWFAVLLLNIGFTAMLFIFSYSAGWDWHTYDYTGFWTPIGFVRNLVFNGWHPIFPWLGFLLIGVWLGRLDLRSRSVRIRCMAWGAVIGLSAEAVSWFVVVHLGLEGRWAYLFGRGCVPPNPMFATEATAGAVFVVALCMEIGERWRNAAWLHPLVVMGQYSLSIYVGHILLVILPLVYFAGMEEESLVCSSICALITCAIALAFCFIWSRFFPRGPLEMILRRFSDGKPRPGLDPELKMPDPNPMQG